MWRCPRSPLREAICLMHGKRSTIRMRQKTYRAACTAGRALVDAPVIVRMRGISKAFGGVPALKDVELTLRSGEIHGLLGENGAGKSTLLKILRGVETPDAGTIEIQGKQLGEYTPEVARLAGIAMIFQQMSLVPALSVAQNIFLNREVRDRFGLIDDQRAIESAHALFDDFGIDIDPAMLVSQLGAGQRQITEIVKAISQKT